MPQTLKKDLQDKINALYDRKEEFHKMDIPHRYGILIYGETGTGKSSLAAALAGFLWHPLPPASLTRLKRCRFRRSSKSTQPQGAWGAVPPQNLNAVQFSGETPRWGFPSLIAPQSNSPFPAFGKERVFRALRSAMGDSVPSTPASF